MLRRSDEEKRSVSERVKYDIITKLETAGIEQVKATSKKLLKNQYKLSFILAECQ